MVAFSVTKGRWIKSGKSRGLTLVTVNLLDFGKSLGCNRDFVGPKHVVDV
jgi:hypothetical protein